jgi:DNA-damage-inducible protein J
MPGDTVVRARINPRIKREAEAVLATKGLSISEVLRQLMLHIIREKELPFELIIPEAAPVKQRKRKMDSIVTEEMRHYSGTKSLNYFGFRGNRAAISLLYARSEGASQAEVNEVGRALGSPQENYLNMLHQALKWRHEVSVWDDPPRGGKVYKLFYNPNHNGPGEVAPPDNWKEMNKPKIPPGVTPISYQPHRSS